MTGTAAHFNIPANTVRAALAPYADLAKGCAVLAEPAGTVVRGPGQLVMFIIGILANEYGDSLIATYRE